MTDGKLVSVADGDRIESSGSEVEKVVGLVNESVEKAFERYREQKTGIQPAFSINDERLNGTGLVSVKSNFWGDNHLLPYMYYRYQDGQLVEMAGEGGWGTRYQYYPATGEFTIGEGEYRGQNEHHVVVQGNKDGVVMRDFGSLLGGVFVSVEYALNCVDGQKAFAMKGMRVVDVNDDARLPMSDVIKILPKGHLISLDQVINAAVDPEINRRPDFVNRADGFVNLDLTGYGSRGISISTHGSDVARVNGYAYPIEGQADNWLALAIFGNGDRRDSQTKLQARALFVGLERESIVCDDLYGDSPVIKAKVLIEGVEHKVEFPMSFSEFLTPEEAQGRHVVQRLRAGDGEERVICRYSPGQIISALERNSFDECILTTALKNYMDSGECFVNDTEGER